MSTSKYSRKTKEKVLTAINNGMSVGKAGALHGVRYTTARYWMKNAKPVNTVTALPAMDNEENIALRQQVARLKTLVGELYVRTQFGS
jgi:hypothetical protein